MTDMIPVLEITRMGESFSQESCPSNRLIRVHLGSVYKTLL